MRRSPSSNQKKPSNNKNWVFMPFSLAIAILLAALGYSLLHKSAQIAGTWQLEANGLPSGSQLITIIISPDGKITALNPQNPKEAIEVAKITKISDITTAPEGAKVQANLFANQAIKARQSEAKTYVATLNRGQQAYYVEKNSWGQNIDALGIGVKSETENYRYNTQIVSSIKTANIKNYQGVAVQTGLAKKEGLRSYLGIVSISTVSDNDITSMSLLCESSEPTTKEAGLPKFDGKTVQCPDGYTSLN